jgi:hypothetical protein
MRSCQNAFFICLKANNIAAAEQKTIRPVKQPDRINLF